MLLYIPSSLYRSMCNSYTTWDPSLTVLTSPASPNRGAERATLELRDMCHISLQVGMASGVIVVSWHRSWQSSYIQPFASIRQWVAWVYSILSCLTYAWSNESFAHPKQCSIHCASAGWPTGTKHEANCYCSNSIVWLDLRCPVHAQSASVSPLLPSMTSSASNLTLCPSIHVLSPSTDSRYPIYCVSFVWVLNSSLRAKDLVDCKIISNEYHSFSILARFAHCLMVSSAIVDLVCVRGGLKRLLGS